MLGLLVAAFIAQTPPPVAVQDPLNTTKARVNGNTVNTGRGPGEIIYVEPNKERRVEYRDVLALMWGLSASGDPDTGYPAVTVSFQILGRARIR